MPPTEAERPDQANAIKKPWEGLCVIVNGRAESESSWLRLTGRTHWDGSCEEAKRGVKLSLMTMTCCRLDLPGAQ